jgi:Ala-tRNA(Pro) deacylase
MVTPVLARAHAGLVDWLHAHHVDHEVHEHPETFTATTTAEAEGVDPRTFAKVVGVAVPDGRTALIALDATDRVDLAKAAALLGATDARLLTETELAAATPGCEAGAVPAVGGLFGLPMYADHAVGVDPEISFHAGTHRLSVRVDRASWEAAARVRYADLAVRSGEVPAWAKS